MPGTQRSALTSVQMIRERQPGIERRLASCALLVEGLTAAAASPQADLASDASLALSQLSQ